MESKIKNVFDGFKFDKKICLLLFWKNTTPGNSWYLKLTGQPSLANREHERLQNYKKYCLRYGEVRPETWEKHDCFAGQVAKEMRAQLSTNPDQFLAQFGVPIFDDRELLGVIEIVTLTPKEDYNPDLRQLGRLLKAENKKWHT
ncbi:hypothetical protein CTI12_AA029150 [Artemisia annua]|uniref:GAF domain-containing protein n=1 Tax=Artemisia annua TaxID=35608 RepID=A0A2U1QHH2_ARTAN|nr:hypothetical protein CTI12_AA029150 [Artemisia annua]